jgi:hypothetical protein
MSASAPVQKAIKAVLSASAELTALMGGTSNVYDRVPDQAPFPYVTISDAQVLPDESDNTCDQTLREVLADIHVWARAADAEVQCKLIGDLLDTLLAVPLSLEQWHCHSGSFENANYFWDADGVTGHGVIRFRYLVQAF